MTFTRRFSSVFTTVVVTGMFAGSYVNSSAYLFPWWLFPTVVVAITVVLTLMSFGVTHLLHGDSDV
ncbi:hypothetical protein [Haloarcula sp. CGMCC 1.6347]|uniref:hypothetical protein n=1 Tax=Haloarcula sp. CGMCC 1.6347 TaxID=3111455 RepID=UPI00300ED9EF